MGVPRLFIDWGVSPVPRIERPMSIVHDTYDDDILKPTQDRVTMHFNSLHSAYTRTCSHFLGSQAAPVSVLPRSDG